MSVSESIYNLLPKEKQETKKQAMYISKSKLEDMPGSTFGCTGNTRLIGAGKLTKRDHLSFGPQKDVNPLPKNITESKATVPCHKKHLSNLPKVPKRDEISLHGLFNDKNFVLTNAIEAVLNKSSERRRRPIELDYLKKEDFGKVPAYLAGVKSLVNQEREVLSDFASQQSEIDESALEKLSESDRRDLINGLKTKWGLLNTEYQKIAHLSTLDTVGKVRRKEQLEQGLTDTEREIERLEKAPKILIK